MSAAFRCSAHSSALAEPLAGTASTVRAFLLLEVPGPWGVDALRDCRLPVDLASELDRRCRRHGVRPLLIRRHGRSRRSPTGPARCFAAYAHPGKPWLESGTLAGPEEALDLDLAQLGRGASSGLDHDPEPVLLVCTHGGHDACCAELGRPLVAALTASHPDHTWECSHIGGDRFAGNLLALPDGLYYGRVDQDTGPKIAEGHLAGHLDLDHLRGRAGFGFAVQAAEWHLRRRLALTGAHDVRLERRRADGDVTETVFVTGREERWSVRVRTSHGEPHQLTCRAEKPRRALRQELVGLERLAPGEMGHLTSG